MNGEWFCKRCKTPVQNTEDFGNYVAGKCKCDTCPCPWTPVSQQPSHSCVVCDALWLKHDDGSWSLCSEACGNCCDNAPMGDQISRVEPVPIHESQPPYKVRQAFIQDMISRKMTARRSDHIKLPILAADRVLLVLIEHHKIKCAEEGVEP